MSLLIGAPTALTGQGFVTKEQEKSSHKQFSWTEAMLKSLDCCANPKDTRRERPLTKSSRSN